MIVGNGMMVVVIEHGLKVLCLGDGLVGLLVKEVVGCWLLVKEVHGRGLGD